MKFWEAMKALDEGRKVRCCYWNPGHFMCADQKRDNTSANDTMNFWFEKDKEWEIYEEPLKQYTFSEIIPLLKEGKKFKRKDWEGKFIFQSIKHIYVFSTIVNNSWGWVVRVTDAEGTDWIEVKR